MTRIKLELVAVDDCSARNIMHILHEMLDELPLGKKYSISDTDGSCVADVTREDNGIERGMEVTL